MNDYIWLAVCQSKIYEQFIQTPIVFCILLIVLSIENLWENRLLHIVRYDTSLSDLQMCLFLCVSLYPLKQEEDRQLLELRHTKTRTRPPCASSTRDFPYQEVAQLIMVIHICMDSHVLGIFSDF